jgi:hypothetical protein
MSRLTGSDALGLFEAYQAVYVPQELTEEQVWEEVENWVNSLVEEGYDLSDYTWEEMYESYINEASDLDMGLGRNVLRNRTPKPAPISNTPYQSRFARPRNANTTVRNSATGEVLQKPKIGGINDPKYRGQELQQAAKARASQVGTPRQGTAGGPTVGGNTPIGPSPTKTSSTPPRPAARTSGGTPAKPAATPPASTKPKAANTPPASTSTPTPRPKDTSITDMIGRSQVRQGAPVNTGSSSSDARAMAARSSVGTATASPSSTAAKPTPAAPKKTPLQQRLNTSFDLFDVVMGHLLDEGYADTEESALAIMANMSEEWRESIVEGGINVSVPSRIDDFNNRRDMLKNRYGQDVGPRIPGPSGGGQYGEPPAPKAMGVRLARGTSSSKRGVESKNNA